MKTIAKIEMVNYRSHANSTIEFGMLTSIIGENDAGKSNVYRALEMVLLNLPFSQAQLRYGTKEGSVTVTFTDGTWIRRERKGSSQSCTLSTNPKPYVTIKDITEIVQEFTGFKPITIDKNTKAESVQMVPIDAGQTYLVKGTSADGVMRRVNRLLSGSGVETARIALEKDLRVIEKSNSQQVAEATKQEKVVNTLTAEVWDTVADTVLNSEALFVQLAEVNMNLELLDETRMVLQNVDRVLKAKASEPEVGYYTTLDKDLGELRDIQQKLRTLGVNKAVVPESLAALEDCYTEEDANKLALEALETTIAEERTRIEAEQEKEREVARLKREEELKKEMARKAEQDKLAEAAKMKAAKVCPTCKRPL